MSEKRCPKSWGTCEGCEGTEQDKNACPEWETAREVSMALRAMITHVKNTSVKKE